MYLADDQRPRGERPERSIPLLGPGWWFVLWSLEGFAILAACYLIITEK